MGMVKEFKEFAVKGNVADMAVGIMIGSAFTKIVSSLVNDIVTPPLGYILGGVNFRNFRFTLKSAEGEAAAITLNYGAFFQTVFDFLIIAFAMFLTIKGMNTLRRKEEEKPSSPPKPSKEEMLLGEIRDILKANR